MGRRGFDQRRHQAQTERMLMLAGFGAMLALVGGLAWWQLGVGPAVCGVIAVGAAAALLGLLWLLLTAIERWVGPD